MKNDITILKGQLQNFILYSIDMKERDFIWGNKTFIDIDIYDEKYNWRYIKEDKEILEEFLNGN